MHRRVRSGWHALALCLLFLPPLLVANSAKAALPLALVEQAPLLDHRPAHTRLVGLKRAIKAAYGSPVAISGTLKSVEPGRILSLQLKRRGRWIPLKHTRVQKVGRFRFRWRPKTPGVKAVRVKFTGDSEYRAAQKSLRVKIVRFKIAQASYYGMFGARTACGQTLTPNTVGVAHKTLPCGTLVTFANHGHTVTAPVLDRGPYVAGREFDLTVGLKNKLNFGSTGSVRYAVD